MATINSRASSSHRYSVNTSRMEKNMHNMNKMKEAGGQMDFRRAIDLFQMDLGRIDYPNVWYTRIRTFIVLAVMMISSMGGHIMPANELHDIIYYITAFVPEETHALLKLVVYLVFILVHIAIAVYTYYMINCFRQTNFPSSMEVYIWLGLTRVFLPIFTCFVGDLFWRGVFKLVFVEVTDDEIIETIAGFVLLFLNYGTQIVASRLTTCTPVFRMNDLGQLWFIYADNDWRILFLVFITSFLQNVISNSVLSHVVFAAVNVLIFGFAALVLLVNLPFIRAMTNAVYATGYAECALFSFLPLVAEYAPTYITYVFIGMIFVFFAILGVFMFIVNKRVQGVVGRFMALHEEDEEQDDDGLGLFGASKLHDLGGGHNKVDWDMMDIGGERDMLLLMRIGFLYNVEDVTNLDFCQAVLAENASLNLFMTSAQIALATQSDMKLLNDYIRKIPLHRNRSHASFATLLTELRLEVLTQMNQPLLAAIGRAKKRNNMLTSTISDFWGAVLKQKMSAMMTLIPQISTEMQRCDRMYQHLQRNYPTTPLVLRELSTFYHKSLGNHQQTMIAQANYNRNKRAGGETVTSTVSMDDTRSINYGDVDKAFVQRMEPYLAAQEAIENIPSTAEKCLQALVIFTFIFMIAIPTVVLAFGNSDVEDLIHDSQPITNIGDMIYTISRIPQLIRRKNLYAEGLVMGDDDPDWYVSTGPPLSSLLEFVRESSIMPFIRKYTEQLKEETNDFLQMCKTNTAVSEQCETADNIRIVGTTESKVTAYELIQSFINAADNFVDRTEWTDMKDNTDLKFLFENFDSSFEALTKVLEVVEDNVLDQTNRYKLTSIIFYAVCWGIPLVILLPFTAIALAITRDEIDHILKLFFSIPKSAISSIRIVAKHKRGGNGGGNRTNEQIMMKSQTDKSDLSVNSVSATDRQGAEDHLAETLATMPRISYGLFSFFWASFIILWIIVCGVTSAAIALYKTSMDDVLQFTNGHMQAIHVTSTSLGSYVWTQELFSTDPVLPSLTREVLQEKSMNYVNKLNDYFDMLLYGTPSRPDFKPGILLADDILSHFIKGSTNVNVRSAEYQPVHGMMHDVYFSMGCEAQFRQFTDIARFTLNSTDTSLDTLFNFSTEFAYHYEHILFAHLAAYFINGRAIMSEDTDEIKDEQREKLLLVCIVLYTVSLLFYATIFLKGYHDAKHRLWTARHLLLLVDPEALLKSQSVMKWLAGHSRQSGKKVNDLAHQTRNKLALDFIADSSRCGIVVTDSSLLVQQANAGALSFLRIDKDKIIGSNARELFAAVFLERDKILSRFDKSIEKMRLGNNVHMKDELRASMMGPTGQTMYLGIQINGYALDNEDNRANSFSIALYDRTTEHFQEALVESEKAKGEKLVTSLLPPSIIQRMNDGEKEISFEVQKATVLFTAIVGWTDLIKDWDAVHVMSFLNRLFSAYDAELANFPQITKIKTIGHIYMIAGGLFSDLSVNSASIVTQYALKILEIVDRIRTEDNIDFQVTVGVNTGGPVNCGILGHTRPVFDILGDVVNVSSRMNSFSLPGYIQIPEATYDQIKFLNYNIRERGEIFIKGKGKMKTYLVSQSAH